MEILDLRAAHFVQYRPEGPFSGQEFEVTEVARDRQWFADALPVMRSFISDWRALQNDPDAHQKILGTRRRACRVAEESVAPEELWAAVATRACPFVEPPPTESEDPFGEAAAEARSRLLTETVAVAACPFSFD